MSDNGINLDDELKKITGGNYDPNQNEPVSQGGKGFKGMFSNYSSMMNGTALKIGGVVVAVLVILGLGWIFILPMFSGKTANKPVQTEETTGARTVFKSSIQPAVDGQSAKGKISEKWRSATVNYSKDQDLEKFKQEILKINDERTSYIEKIVNQGSELDTVVTNALNNQREYLNKSFNVDNSSDAISVYNEWNSSDKAFDEEYISTLKALLDKAGIKYKVVNENNKTTINY